MKVFFIADRKDKEAKQLGQNVIDILDALNVKVDKSLMKTTHEEDYQNFENTYKRNLQSIKQSDVIVAETSSISSGIGFLLARAIDEKKPVIALYKEGYKSRPSITLKGVHNKLFLFQEYTDKDLKAKLSSALESMRKQLDTKFILIIPSAIDRYLEWASDYKRMHKAQLVRQAIEDYMENDTDWKEFLSEE